MAGFVKGDVVVIPFPFSDLSGSKKRPALVLADLPGNDIVLCQITSQQSNDASAIYITSTDFKNDALPVSSYIRPTRILPLIKISSFVRPERFNLPLPVRFRKY
ncbi:type II toxin-antitoxin system PemK/MazF family toxin [Mucilaginibacter terrae]|uniref:type II toxin-antitoxin system PemK/MazF family toxin n=1 Tax=Mucilaginibacter terrae TaxID=1955052 RepID=UPI00363FDF39